MNSVSCVRWKGHTSWSPHTGCWHGPPPSQSKCGELFPQMSCVNASHPCAEQGTCSTSSRLSSSERSVDAFACDGASVVCGCGGGNSQPTPGTGTLGVTLRFLNHLTSLSLITWSGSGAPDCAARKQSPHSQGWDRKMQSRRWSCTRWSRRKWCM